VILDQEFAIRLDYEMKRNKEIDQKFLENKKKLQKDNNHA